MKKWIKIVLGIIGIVLLYIVIDIACILKISKPLIPIKKEDYYVGLFYNVYDCEEYSIPQIVSKNKKISCIKSNVIDTIK